MSETESKRETDVLESDDKQSGFATQDDCSWLVQAWQATRKRAAKDRQMHLTSLIDYPSPREFDFGRWLCGFCPFRDVRITVQLQNRASAFIRNHHSSTSSESSSSIVTKRIELRLSEYVSISHPLSPLQIGLSTPDESDESVEADSSDDDDRTALCEWYLISGRVSTLDWLLWQTHPQYWMPMIEVFSKAVCLNQECDCCPLTRATCLALCIEACSMYGESSASVMYFQSLFASFEPRLYHKCHDLVSFGMRVLCRVLCYQPWTINSSMIDEVINHKDFTSFLSDSTTVSVSSASELSSDSEGGGGSMMREKEESMSVEAFVHSVIVIVTAQSLGALMEGMLVPLEWDLAHECNPAVLLHQQNQASSDSSSSVSGIGSGSVSGRSRKRSRSRSSSSGSGSGSVTSKKTKSTTTKMKTRSSSIEEARLKAVSPNAYALFDSTPYSYVPTDEFNWRDGAYSIASRYAPELTDLLDECFRVAYSMTDDSAAGIEMDTLNIRDAMRHCVDRMHGVRDDAYDYSELNTHLSISTKKFISKMVTDPSQLREPEMSKHKLAMGPTESSRKFTDEEIVHIAILATESKRQTQLVHAMRALWLYTRKDAAF